MTLRNLCLLLSVACMIPAEIAPAQQGKILIPRKQDRPPGPPLSPKEAARKMTVPEGFHVEVVASEPDIVNPVAMTFDERGRVWITESLEYPRRSAGPGRDRIKVLEDTTGDGRADKITIFAEGLNIPSGIAVGHGGVWVANAPDLLFLKDTDGDGKADHREVVVTGFGRTDTHELPNSLTWGPDGWLYGLNGVFNYSHVKHRGKDYKFTCALFRIHPKTRDFEIFAEGTSNPWGIAWDHEGSAFVSACVIDHLWHLLESGYYHRQGGPYPPHTWKLGSIVEHKHQKAAYCGIHYFDSDAYPAEYRDRLYMGNIHGNCINVDALQRRGSSYFATGRPDFLTANDVWFMPVVQKTGPDGCLYVLDWYDRYHCYQDANADPEGVDRLKGRLYRVRYRDTPRVTGFNLGEETDDQLIDRLRSPNVYFRDIAQRLLVERNDAQTRPKLQQVVLSDAEDVKTRRHALWALVGTGSLEPAFHRRLLAHEDSFFRAWGVRAAGNFGEVTPEVLNDVLALATDTARDVQVQVAIAAPKLESVDPLLVLTTVLTQCGTDEVIPHIVWQNLHPLLENRAGEFLTQLAQAGIGASPGIAAMLPHVTERILDGGRRDPAVVARLVNLLTADASGNPAAAAACLEVLASRVQTRELSGAALQNLRQELAPTISRILRERSHADVAFHAALLATSWRDPAALDATRRLLADTAASSDRRRAALSALISAGDKALLPAVDALLGAKQKNPVDFRGEVLAELARLDDPSVAEVVLGHYGTLEPELQPRVIELLTQRKPWARALLEAIGRKSVSADALNLNQVRRLLATGDAELAESVRRTWGTVRDTRDPNREQKIAEMKKLIRSRPGDPFAGEQVFKRVCGQCHTMYGQGAEVGPDITLNGRSSFDQLLSNVFDPSLVIGAAYQAHTVVTIEGRVLTGLVVEDTKARLVLKVQGGKLETIPADEIDFRKVSEVSMMPEQLETQVKSEEMADLFAYLVLDRHPSDPNARQLPGVREVKPRQTNKPAEFGDLIAEVAPGFGSSAVGEGGLALLKEHAGQPAVLRTHPVDRERPCVLSGEFEIPKSGKPLLLLWVSHHPQGDWELIVRIDGRPRLETVIGPSTTVDGWVEHRVDLSDVAGQTVKIEALNSANGWNNEFGYWGRLGIVIVPQ